MVPVRLTLYMLGAGVGVPHGLDIPVCALLQKRASRLAKEYLRQECELDLQNCASVSCSMYEIDVISAPKHSHQLDAKTCRQCNGIPTSYKTRCEKHPI